MRMHCIIHADFELPGYYATWAKARDITVTKTHIEKGEALPSTDTYDILLCMGGPQSPLKMEEYPYLADEVQHIKAAIQADKRVLGVCLGAQLIAESYGAQTMRSPHREIGVFPVSLTDAGKADPILQHFPDVFPSGHWHDDMPGVPEGAEVLAQSAGCPRQIIRFAEKVYGFQCHLEFDKACMVALLDQCDGRLREQTYVQSPDVILSQNYDEINQHLALFLTHFLKQ